MNEEHQAWVKQIIQIAIDAIASEGSLAWRARRNEEIRAMEVQIFPAVLVVGGEEIYSSSLVLNVVALLKAFDDGTTVSAEDGILVFTGTFAKNPIELAVFWDPPDDVSPSAEVDADGTERVLSGSREDSTPQSN